MRAGYADRPITKAPNWHGLVVLDTLLNNMTTGLFIVAALGDLAVPRVFAAVARVAYPIAFLLLLADLLCLVLDLGDPLRFHHMLRVWKPSSPMSFGTWCLTIYSLPLTIVTAMSLLPGAWTGAEWARHVVALVGLPPALGTAAYKGVLFSTTAQPGWRDARWLGGYLASSAVLLGAAQLLAISVAAEHWAAAMPLRSALGALLLLNAVTLGLVTADLRPTLARTYDRVALVRVALLALGGGILAPLVLLLLSGATPLVCAALLAVLGALLVRAELVGLPHHHVGDPEALDRHVSPTVR